SELEDPRFQTDYWEEQIELQLDIGKKAEQQALAARGLDFVTDTYLPERLDEMGVL
ncbi:MAG: DNA topoisomerase VI, partial [Haloferacaceae archaeon]